MKTTNVIFYSILTLIFYALFFYLTISLEPSLTQIILVLVPVLFLLGLALSFTKDYKELAYGFIISSIIVGIGLLWIFSMLSRTEC